MPRSTVRSLSIHATPGLIHIRGDVEQDMRLAADEPLRSLLVRPNLRSLDFLNIAAGVYAADRAIKRKANRGNEKGIRSLHLIFAVQDLAFWLRAEVAEAVAEIVNFLTDENWSFEFKAAAVDLRAPHEQMRLELPWTRRPGRIALYSGGLDSAAGLANRVMEGIDDYLLVTVGHQSALRRRCADQIRQLSHWTGTTKQLHTTLVVALRGGAAKRMSQQEGSQRSRAFLFCAASAVVARSCDVDTIEIFENGIGSINFPIMAGMLSGGLATRGAHPTFLRSMSRLSSAVAERTVQFSLPFASRTKAQMLERLKALRLETWLQLSRSCVHTSWRQRNTPHCGQCPGCVERRQAFRIAGIQEQVGGQYSVDLLSGEPLAQENADYLRRYLDDAKAWIAGEVGVRNRLAWHLSDTSIPPEEQLGIAGRQARHAAEVMAAFGHLPFVLARQRYASERRHRTTTLLEA